MMARPNHDTRRMDDLLASVTSDLLSDLPQNLDANAIHVERILLEMVRPDPVQPRRVLPESIHLNFHNNRVTPTQALRELVQLVQIRLRVIFCFLIMVVRCHWDTLKDHLKDFNKVQPRLILPDSAGDPSMVCWNCCRMRTMSVTTKPTLCYPQRSSFCGIWSTLP